MEEQDIYVGQRCHSVGDLMDLAMREWRLKGYVVQKLAGSKGVQCLCGITVVSISAVDKKGSTKYEVRQINNNHRSGCHPDPHVVMGRSRFRDVIVDNGSGGLIIQKLFINDCEC